MTLKYLGVAWAAGVALGPAAVAASQPPGWEALTAAPGAFDLGQRSDGSLVVAGSTGLYTLAPSGLLTPWPSFASSGYLAVTPPAWSAADSCDNFGHDAVYVVPAHAPVAVTRLDAATARASDFSDLQLATVTGITFDVGGGFGYRLLVTGLLSGKTELVGVDCAGSSEVIANGLPAARGGIVVAPAYTGAISGDLLMPDAATGTIWAVSPSGRAFAAVTGLPQGDAAGIASVADVPPGFGADSFYSYAYFADTGGSRVLRLPASAVTDGGVEANGLVAATADGALFAITCQEACRATQAHAPESGIHGGGHLAFSLLSKPRPTLAPGLPVSDDFPPPNRLANLVPLALLVGPFALMALVAWAISRNRR